MSAAQTAQTASMLDRFSQQLIAAQAIFHDTEMSLSSVERFTGRVGEIAEALAAEAESLKARSRLVAVARNR